MHPSYLGEARLELQGCEKLRSTEGRMMQFYTCLYCRHGHSWARRKTTDLYVKLRVQYIIYLDYHHA
jgi:hypothetical protein